MQIPITKHAAFIFIACLFMTTQLASTSTLADGHLIAFPGAEGYGRFAQGGRGGDVYHVTNLKDSGPGSIRYGIESANGPRTIVFDLSGTIELKSDLSIKEKSKITIAGQTAPGDGITFKDYGLNLSQSSDIIIRYIRIRLGDQNKPPSGPDSISVNDCDNIMLDHLSISWGIDGNQDIRRCSNYTFQWSIMSEALHDSIHPKGAHGMAGSFRGPTGNISIHHNIFASSRNRHPTLGGSTIDPKWIIDFRNNVIYNQTGPTNICDNRVNFIGNYYRPGPETNPKTPFVAMKAKLPNAPQGHMSGNVFEGRDDLTKDNYAALDFEFSHRSFGTSYPYAGNRDTWSIKRPYDLGLNTPTTHSAKKAYKLLLAGAGASLKRDAVDNRFIKDIKNRTGKLLDSQDQVGGWPELKSTPTPKDTDQDGMPNKWEIANNLNPKNPDDRNADADKDGYTNLEEYLNSLCPQLIK